MSIIIIRGFSQSGKDYVGNILCRKYGYTRFAFADSLKKIVAQKYNCSIEQLHSQDGKSQICESDPSEKKRTYRQILIDEAFTLRSSDPDIFINHCIEEIKKSGAKHIVITDWRYPNEIQVLHELNYKIIPVHIIRADQDKSPVNDESEYQLDKRTTDYTIINNMDASIYAEIWKLIQFISYDLALLGVD